MTISRGENRYYSVNHKSREYRTNLMIIPRWEIW